jgi:hypothetical protein
LRNCRAGLPATIVFGGTSVITIVPGANTLDVEHLNFLTPKALSGHWPSLRYRLIAAAAHIECRRSTTAD